MQRFIRSSWQIHIPWCIHTPCICAILQQSDLYCILQFICGWLWCCLFGVFRSTLFPLDLQHYSQLHVSIIGIVPEWQFALQLRLLYVTSASAPLRDLCFGSFTWLLANFLNKLFKPNNFSSVYNLHSIAFKPVQLFRFVSPALPLHTLYIMAYPSGQAPPFNN